MGEKVRSGRYHVEYTSFDVHWLPRVCGVWFIKADAKEILDIEQHECLSLQQQYRSLLLKFMFRFLSIEK